MFEKYNEEKLYKELARAYYKLLTTIDLNDVTLERGIHEGLNKFLSNSFIKAFKKINSKGKYVSVDKKLISHYISKNALDRLKQSENNCSGLVFEHIVPKNYIQDICINKVLKEGKESISEEYIYGLLKKYWVLATITKEEDKSIPRFAPKGWDGDVENKFIRYDNSGIELLSNELLNDYCIEISDLK